MNAAESPLTPTGRQFSLSRGSVTAQIAQVGASLRSLVVGGVDIVPPYPADAATPMCSGVVLVPWPNRVRDGVWGDNDETRALSISEPKHGNASHGLLRFASYEARDHQDDSIELGAAVVPQTGYPYLLDTTVRYRLTDSGIEVTHTLTNRGSGEAPVALGTHPFVTIGDAAPEELVLRVQARTRFVTDDRMLPVDEVPVSGSFDLREGKRLGDVSLDTCFADLDRDADGRVRSSLTAPDGRNVTLWQGEGFDYVQAFTTGGYPGQPLAVAVEPMTAPADAFNSGRGLRRLSPGETWTLAWGIEFAAA